MKDERRHTPRVPLDDAWDVLIRSMPGGHQHFDHRALIDPAACRGVELVDVSAGGAALRATLPKPAGIHLGGMALAGVQPTPDFERRWLCAEVVNLRFQADRSVLLGMRWLDCDENARTVEVLQRFTEKRLRRV